MNRNTKSVRIIEGDAEVLKMLAAAEGCTVGDVIHRQLVHFSEHPPKRGVREITVAILRRAMKR